MPEPRVSVSSTSTRANRTGAWKYIRPQHSDGVAPCNARCPTGVDVEGYMNLLRQDRVAEALDLLLRENPMPAITGRVCHHPCESSCNRARLDEAVVVHLVERELGDRILSGRIPILARTRTERVAVIGSGPAGLACAWHLARLGYGVTVFEAAAEAGGMLRQGIPPYRLPRLVLDAQVEWFRQAGIEIRCGVEVRGALRDALHAEYDALFVATGAHRSRPFGLAGAEPPNVIGGLDFLRAVNRGERPFIGRNVIVIGGGNTAMDCARTARRLGATPVVVYRRTRAEMPAIAAEVEEAVREGVLFEQLAAPRALHTHDGRLIGVECERMALGEPDESGRRAPVPSGHEPFIIPADSVISAIGEDALFDALPDEAMVVNGAVTIDALGATSVRGVWAGGDAAGVERTVSAALGSGKAAAIGIDRALRERRGEPVPPREAMEALRWSGGSFRMGRWRGDDPVRRTAERNDVVTFEAMNAAHFARVPRQLEPVAGTSRSGNGRPDFGEVNLGLAPRGALEEARRCLNCAVCNDCELCLVLCPDVAIARVPEHGGFTIDLDHCKGCGVCALECPRGAIVMTREAL